MTSRLENANRPTVYFPALAYTGTAANSTVLIKDDQGGAQVQLSPTTTCFVAIGSGAVATANSMRLPANIVYQCPLQAGDRVSAIQESAGGTLSITIMN